MKKMISMLMVVLLALSSTVCAAEKAERLSDQNILSKDGMFAYEPFALAPDNGRITAYYGGNMVNIPAEIDGVQIYEVGERAFFDLDILTAYISEGVVVIGASAFEGSNVTDVTIPKSVDDINDRAFANCTELVTITLYSDQIQFGEDALANTTYLQCMVPCILDTEGLREKLITAKGADNFEFVAMHEHLTQSEDEKDAEGNPILYCADCGLRGSHYREDVAALFEDVSPESWYADAVQSVYDKGIMIGKTETLFDPESGMTLGEAVAIAARIREKQHHLHTSFDAIGEMWYDVYVEYAYRNGIIEDGLVFDWEENATRAEMAYLFSRCDRSDTYINDVPMTDIPDVYDTTPYVQEILDLYHKGIVVGNDASLAYAPDAYIKRCEVAAIVDRIMDTEKRIELPKG